MTSRLRLAVMASHRAEELRAAARILGEVVHQAMDERKHDPWIVDGPSRAHAPSHGGTVFDLEASGGEDAPRGEAVAPRVRPALFDFEADERLAA